MKWNRRYFRALMMITLVMFILEVMRLRTSPEQNKEDKSDQASANFTTLDPILQPSLNTTNFFLLILVPSSSIQHRAFLQRQAIRETWGQNNENPSLHGNMLNAHEWKVVFLLGRTPAGSRTHKVLRESMRYNDILQGSFNDGYYSVTHKVFMGFIWAILQTDFQFLFKADQDVYIRIPRVVKWLQKRDFPARLYGGLIKESDKVPRAVGNSHAISRRLYSKDFYPPYALGAFVLISRTVVADMLKASKVHPPIIYDDPYLGILAEEAKVGAFSIRNFLFNNAIRYSFGKLVKCYSDCQLVSVLAVGDRIDYQMQYYLHSRFREIDAVNLTTKSSKCRWLNLLELSVFDGRLIDYFNNYYHTYMYRNPELFTKTELTF